MFVCWVLGKKAEEFACNAFEIKILMLTARQILQVIVILDAYITSNIISHDSEERLDGERATIWQWMFL